MAPGFKLSFSRPSFRSHASSESSFSVQSPQSGLSSRHDGTPPSLPSSKAENILGGPELERQIGTAKKRSSSKERRSLRKFPSFMSYNSADASGDSPIQEEEFPFIGMRQPNDFEGPTPRTVRRQGSSPLLGYQPSGAAGSTDYFTSGPKTSTRRTETASSLMSTQSFPRSPLRNAHAVTSPSMPDLSPLGSNPHIIVPLMSPTIAHQPQVLKQSTLTHSRSVSGGSARSRLTVPRRRPSVTDPPTLYPEAPRTAYAPSPPAALITSSLPKSTRQLNSHTKTLNRPRWWLRNKGQDVQDVPAIPCINPVDEVQPASSIKVNVRKPKAGANHWFDSYSEDDAVNPAGGNAEPIQEHVSQPVPVSAVPQGDDHAPQSEWVENPALLSKKSSFSSKTTHSDRKLNLRFEFPVSEQQPVKDPLTTPKRLPNLKSRDSQTSSLRSAGYGIGSYQGLDLQMHSVLSLSSSDEEDDFEEVESKAGAGLFQSNASRTFSENIDEQGDMIIPMGQQTLHSGTRFGANRVPSRHSSRRSKTPERVPPIPQIPSRHPIGHRSSSLRCSDIIEERASSSTDHGGDSAVESVSNGETPLTTPASSFRSVPYKQKSASRNSKLMKVTSDEENLLEAMRNKRASMHLNEYQKGFNEALALQGDAALEGGASVPHSIRSPDPPGKGVGLDPISRSTTLSKRSSMKSSSRSLSPLPFLTSARYGGAPLRAGLDVPSNPKRISTDSYNYEEEQSPGLPGEQTRFPFPPQMPPPSAQLPIPPVQLQLPQHGEAIPSRHSPTLSFSTSEMMSPSTPSTTNQPITPPPMIMSLPPGLVQGGIYRTLSESGHKPEVKLGHDRKRTVSSVVVLDGMELAAREADEERDLIGWAMDNF